MNSFEPCKNLMSCHPNSCQSKLSFVVKKKAKSKAKKAPTKFLTKKDANKALGKKKPTKTSKIRSREEWDRLNKLKKSWANQAEDIPDDVA